MKKIFFIVCESSGDRFIADVTKLLPKTEFELFGMGGDRMIESGVDVFQNINSFSVMGFWEVVKKIFFLKKLIKNTAKQIIEKPPSVVFSVDSYSFCIRVAKIVHKHNKSIPFIHAVAPSVWLYGEKKAYIMSKHYQKLFCVLPFEPKYFQKYGLNSEFIGYHAAYYVSNRDDKFDTDYFKICVTLGSRMFEVKNNILMIKKVLLNVSKSISCKIKFYFPCVNDNIARLVKNEFKDFPSHVFINNENAVIPAYDFVIAKSGTNTIEFIKNREPIIVYYKVSSISALIFKLKSKNNFKFANLINIIADREIIPEFLQKKCNSELISSMTIKMITNANLRTQQIHETQTILEKMKNTQSITPFEIVADFLKKM